MTKIGIVVGSIRENSFSLQLANNLVKRFPEGFEAEFIQISHLPLYNQDSDNNVPESYQKFRQKIKSMDGIVFVTPEHNRSFPAALKNALDIASRPYGENMWDNKPALIVSQSPSNLSGFGANHHLRQVMTFLNMPVIQQPEVYIPNVTELVDDDGNITNEDTIEFLQTVTDAYVNFVKNH